MDTGTAIRSIDATLRKRGFSEVGPGLADYEGAIQVHGKNVNIKIVIPDVRFVRKPRVLLLDRSQIPLEILAHIERETGVCYSSGAGLPLDLYEPGQAVLRVLAEVQQTLELSYRGRGLGEVIDEYQHYWYPKVGVRTLLPRRSPTKTVQAKMFFAKRSGEPDFLCLASDASIRGYEAEHPREARIEYVSTPIGPSKGIDAPENLLQFRTWFEAQESLRNLRWNAAFNWLIKGNALFIAAPNAFVGLTIQMAKDIAVGVQRGSIRENKLPEILHGRMASIGLHRLAGSWCELGDIVARNTPGVGTLMDKSVALVGCGTIGSHLARFLVQSGAGARRKLSLYDHDILSHGNIGRHLLGFDAIGKPKALAVKAEIDRFHPQVTVQGYHENALELWSELAKHDLIIDATGEWNVQSALNELFLHEHDRPSAMLHAWVFMNGAGVQSFLNLRDDFACFRCLKPEFGGPWRFPVARQDDELNLQPATCGDGAYIPFSVDVSVAAASLALRATLDWAEGKPGPRLRSQVTDTNRGIYQKPRSPHPAPNCPACADVRLK